MPRTRIDFDTVRNIGLLLPEVEEGKSYGAPALKVRGKMLACIPINPSAEPGSLAVSISPEKRAVLVAAVPDTYYLTEHYRPHPIVLVRLSRIGIDELTNLLNLAWQFATAQERVEKRRKTARH